ncbi:MAG: hypothetical protein PHT99_08655 [Methanoregula sp.]|nr:hypothetical protein [Methanoregula sp.]
MRRLHGEIERLVYAAEQRCPCPDDLKKNHFQPSYNELSCTLLDVPFECPMRDYNALCNLPKMRRMLGDHVQQDDPTPRIGECPDGEPVNGRIQCHAPRTCEYQKTEIVESRECVMGIHRYFRDSVRFCGREAAVLAFLEGEDKKETGS